MDSSKDIQWKLAKDEINHVRRQVQHLLSIDEYKNVNMEEIIMFTLGPDSNAGLYLQAELELDKKTYLQFMGTLCIQAAYHISSTQLFQDTSLLKEHLSISEERYNEIWKLMANKKKIPPTRISSSQRELPLWEGLELIVNDILRSVSITGRDGRISVALDDDKIWMNLSDSIGSDLFNIKYATHVKPNRKGIIAHTAVSTAVNIPLGIVFERTRDTTLDCFKRILDFLFCQNGETNLRNVSVHSDRGYMIPNLVFEYLISSGAEVVGTVKRMAQCWPFTYEQTLKEGDRRTLIDPKGAATLFLKWCKAGHKYVFASAFRNGSGSVATAISTMHTQHQWEGIVLKQSELFDYKNNDTSLVSNFFNRISDFDEDGVNESEEEKFVLESSYNIRYIR